MTNSDNNMTFWHTLIDANLPCANPELFSALETQARAKTGSDQATHQTPHQTPHQTKQNTPRLIHLCGLPGSGKTTYARNLAKAHPNFWHMQFDHIMQSLPGYQHTLSTEGTVAAFAQWEQPAAQMGYRLLKMLITEKRNILMDHSAAHPQHPQLIKLCKSLGYYIEMHYLDTPVETVLSRVREREIETGRHTPAQLIHDRHALLQKMLPSYQAQVDKFILVAAQT